MLIGLVSCNFWRESRDENPIAKANGNYLYPSDLIDPSQELGDTERWDQSQIEEWVRRELMYTQAKKEGVDQDLQDKLEDYKQSLMIAAYKQKLLEAANILVSEEKIKAYYKDHLNDYQLDHDLYKLAYYLLPNEDNLDAILKDLNQNGNSNFLNNYCVENEQYCVNSGLWVEDLVLSDLDLPQYLWQSSSKFQTYFRDDKLVCVYRIEAKKNDGEAIPLDQVKPQIIQILKFQQERDLLKKKEDELFLNAQNKKNFEIYK